MVFMKANRADPNECQILWHPIRVFKVCFISLIPSPTNHDFVICPLLSAYVLRSIIFSILRTNMDTDQTAPREQSDQDSYYLFPW